MKLSRFLVVLLLLPFMLRDAASATPPNIVFILADDLGVECLDSYGGTYGTPTLNRLAGKGLQFINCHAQPLCTQSRLQLLTGRYNFRNWQMNHFLPPEETTFSQLLRDAGYATCLVGKWQLGGDGSDSVNNIGPSGFDEYCVWEQWLSGNRYSNPELISNGTISSYPGEYGPDKIVDYAEDFIDRHLDAPFFLFYPMLLPHKPWQPTPDSPEWDPSAPGADEINDIFFYGDMVRRMDKNVKRIVQKINTSGIRRKTLIIFAGDNGTPQRAYSVMADGSIVKGGKSSSRTAGTNVPLIASLPGTIPQGVISDQLVDFTDFFPTLAAVGGAPLPNVVLDGYDLTGHLQDLSPSGRTFVFSWYPKLDGNLLIHARDDRYKLYDTGTFFDCWSDPEEKNQILNPTGAEQAVRDVLQLVLDDYALQGGGR